MKNIYIVTGTSRGLGLALVSALSKQPSNRVYGLSRGSNEYETLDHVHHVEADLRKHEDLPQCIDDIFAALDQKDLESITLINNAGVLSPVKSIHHASCDEIKDNIDVNLTAVMLLTSLFLKKVHTWDIRKQVINISSGAATKPYDGWSVYCGTKAGVDLFTRCIALEQARQPHPAMIIAFYPGVMDTDMQGVIRASTEEDFPGGVQKAIHRKKNNLLLSPDAVAETLLDLLDHRSIESGGIYDVEDLSLA